MSIDTLENTKRINIKDLATDDRVDRPSLTFDTQKDIRSDMWAGIEDIVSETSFSERIKDNYEPLISIAILSPKKMRASMNDEKWDEMREGFKKIALADHVKFRRALCLKLLSPERYSEEALLTDEDWRNLGAKFRSLQNSSEFLAAISIHATVKLLDPDRVTDFGISEYTWGKANEIMQILKSPEYRHIFIERLADFKVVDPDKLKGLGIDDKTWEEVWATKDNSPTPDEVENHIKDLGNLAILAASDIEISKGSIQLNFEKSRGDLYPTSAIPEVRKF